MKKLTWFERVMICMNVCLHKENHQAYKERKLIISNQHKLYKELEKKRDTTPPPLPPPRIGKETEQDSSSKSSESEKTVSYDAWHAKQFPWADFVFEEVSSMPSSSRNTGKAPMVQREIEEDDDDEASGSEYDDDDDDDGDATEEDSE